MKPSTTALSSRGCPSLCTFCTAPSYYGAKYRARSAANVLRELEYLQALGYKEVCTHLDGTITLEQCIAEVTAGTRQLAKHQLTWYRRFADIRWIPGDAPDLITQALAMCRTHLA